MTDQEKKEIIEKAKIFFKDNIAKNHQRNTKKLKLNSFNINPFLHKYISQFTFGDTDSKSLAKSLIYPRIMGTSINTTFGNKMQEFCSSVLSSYASTTSGIDIEFIDQIDGRKKYCQIKSGPQTINKDDVSTIDNHFKAIKNLARTNHLDLRITDCVVGIFYGEPNKLSANYAKINLDYPVYVGEEFWYRLTGDKGFYYDLSDAFAEVASDINSFDLINKKIDEIAKEIDNLKTN